MAPDYELTQEQEDGRMLVRARGTHAKTHLRVTLTFPAGAAGDLAAFKRRLTGGERP